MRYEFGDTDIQLEMYFTDTENDKIYYQDHLNEIMDLCNEQDERIKSLEKEVNQWRKIATDEAITNKILNMELDIARQQGYKDINQH